MKIERTLLEQMRSAYKSVKLEAVDKENLDIEETMATIDIKNFKEEIEYEQIPSNIQNILKFPYIPNTNVIDVIKYDEENKQLMVKFNLNYQKLSELFFLRANTDRLIGKLTSSDHDRLLTIGIENMRLVLIFQFINQIELNGETEPELPVKKIETDAPIEDVELEDETETNEVVKESVEEYSVARVSFEQSMNTIKQSIQSALSEVMEDGERKILMDIWKETQKEITAMLK